MRPESPPASQLASSTTVSVPGSLGPVWRWGFVPALLLGGLVRLAPALSHGWPLNDGGLFFAMAQAMARTGGLPPSVAYNGGLPFCYPPVGFAFAALLLRLGVPLELYFRLAPGLWSTAMVWAGWKLARTVWRDDRAAAAAGLTLALLPWSYVWYVMGGGVARAPAYCFAILAIDRALRLFRDDEARALPPLIVLTALTCATHLECGHYLAVSLLVIAICYVRTVGGAARLLATLAGAAVLSAPWWALCYSRFGAGPFIDAYRSGASGWQHRSWALSGEPYPLLGLVALAGLGLALRRRAWFVPLWGLAIVFAEPRSTRALLSVPIALGVGYLVANLWPTSVTRWNGARAAGATVLVVWGLLLSELYSAHIRALGADDLAAFAFLRAHAAPGTSVLVAAAGNDWAYDRTGEWLPALTSCVSISTTQGSEWLPDNAFAKRWRAHLALEKVTSLAGVESWTRESGQRYRLLYLPLDAAADSASRQTLAGIGREAAQARGYRLWYSNPGVLIYARTP